MINEIIQGDCIESMRTMADKSVNCCVTSPPYFGLRDYGCTGQIGLEQTPEAYIAKMVEVFREVKRVMKDDGTLWLNIGDSYAGSGKGQGPDGANDPKNNKTKGMKIETVTAASLGLKAKDLIGIPWMLAFALRADGWYLRQDIIWHKPNPMPESVTDRCTKSHEYIFLLSKSAKYYYDQDSIKTPVADQTVLRMAQQLENQKGSDRVPGKTNGTMKAVGPGRTPRELIDVKGGNQGSILGIPAIGRGGKTAFRGQGSNRTNENGKANREGRSMRDVGSPAMAIDGNGVSGHSGYFNADGELIGGGLANKKSVWTVTTKPFSEAHFATFPEELIVDCIKAGCPKDGIVLDPFMGAGTTALVARKLGRNYVGCELNPEYIIIAENRLRKELGLFAEAV